MCEIWEVVLFTRTEGRVVIYLSFHTIMYLFKVKENEDLLVLWSDYSQNIHVAISTYNYFRPNGLIIVKYRVDKCINNSVCKIVNDK